MENLGKMEELPLSEIMKHPAVMEMSSTIDYLTSGVKIPYVENDKVLMSPGVWNNYNYSKEDICGAFDRTDWTDRYVTSLYNDHADTKISEWIGEVRNIRLDRKTGFVLGDLYYFDPNTAIKVSMGKPKSGVSPKVEGVTVGRSMTEFVFKNFSHVINPAVKTAYINNSEGNEAVEVSKNGEVQSMNETQNAPLATAETKPIDTPASGDVKVLAAEGIIQKILSILKEGGYTDIGKKEEEKPKDEEKAPEVPIPPIPMSDKVEEKPVIMNDNAELKKTVETMSQKIEMLEKKLKEPEDKVIVSNSSSNSELTNSDVGMLNFLKKRAGN